MIEVRITRAEMAECKSAFDYGQYVIKRMKEAGIPVTYKPESDSMAVPEGTIEYGPDPVSDCQVARWWTKDECAAALRQMVDNTMMQSDTRGLLKS